MEEKYTFLETMQTGFVGIVKPSVHEDAERIKGGHVFLMFLILSTLVALMVACTMLKTKSAFTDSSDELPTFTYAEGVLHVDAVINQVIQGSGSSQSILLIVNTEIDDNVLGQDYLVAAARDAGVNNAFFLSKHKLMFLTEGQYQEMAYTQMLKNTQSLDNASIKPLLAKMFTMITAIAAGIVLLVFIGLYYLSALLYTIVTKVINVAFNTGFDFSTLFRMTATVAFPWWLLKAVLELMTVYVPVLRGISDGYGKLIKPIIIVLAGIAVYVNRTSAKPNSLYRGDMGSVMSYTDDSQTTSYINDGDDNYNNF